MTMPHARAGSVALHQACVIEAVGVLAAVSGCATAGHDETGRRISGPAARGTLQHGADIAAKICFSILRFGIRLWPNNTKADIAEMSAFDEACRIYPMRHTDSSQVSTSFLTWSFAIPYRSWIIPSS